MLGDDRDHLLDLRIAAAGERDHQAFGEPNGGHGVGAKARDPEHVRDGEQALHHHLEDHGDGEQKNGAANGAGRVIVPRSAQRVADVAPGGSDGPVLGRGMHVRRTCHGCLQGKRKAPHLSGRSRRGVVTSECSARYVRGLFRRGPAPAKSPGVTAAAAGTNMATGPRQAGAAERLPMRGDREIIKHHARRRIARGARSHSLRRSRECRQERTGESCGLNCNWPRIYADLRGSAGSWEAARPLLFLSVVLLYFFFWGTARRRSCSLSEELCSGAVFPKKTPGLDAQFPRASA